MEHHLTVGALARMPRTPSRGDWGVVQDSAGCWCAPPRDRVLVRLALAAPSAALLVVTLVWHDWIEIAFRIDPDHGSGWLEWAIVAAAFALMLTFSMGATVSGDDSPSRLPLSAMKLLERA